MLKKYPIPIQVCCVFMSFICLTAAVWSFPAEVKAATGTYTVDKAVDYMSIPTLTNGNTLIINTTQNPTDQKVIEIAGTNVTIIGTGELIQGLSINATAAGARIVLDNLCFAPSSQVPAVSMTKGGTLDLRNGSQIFGNSVLNNEYSNYIKSGGRDAVVNREGGDLRIVGDVHGSSRIEGGRGGYEALDGGNAISSPNGTVVISQNIMIIGGNGYENSSDEGGSGGMGIIASNLTLNGMAFIRGGNGGSGTYGGDGGHGVSVANNINILAKTEIVGGNGGIGWHSGGTGGSAIICDGDIISSGRLSAIGGDGNLGEKGGEGISARNVSLLDVSQISGGQGHSGGHGISVEQRATYSMDSTISGGGSTGLSIYNSKLRTMETFTVTFDTGGGTMLTPATYRVSAPVGAAVFGALPSKITRPGYFFVEWGRAQLGGGSFLSDSPITSNMTVVARWIVGDDIYGWAESIPIRFSDGSTLSLPQADVDTGLYTVNLPSGGDTAYIPMTLLPYAKNLVNVYSSFNIVSNIGEVIIPIDEVLDSEEYRKITARYNAQVSETDLAVSISGNPASCEIFISSTSTGEKLGDLKALELLFVAYQVDSTESSSKASSKAFSEAFSDVPETHWAKKYIDYSAQRGFVSGVGNGKYDPERSVTRAEFIQMIANAFSPTAAGYSGAIFSDVSPTDWFYDSVAAAKAVGLLDKFDEGNFYPNQPITREEMAGVLARVLVYKNAKVTLTNVDLDGLFKDSAQIEPRYKNDVQDVYQTKIMSGVSSDHFVPKGATTRAQAATVLYNMAELLNDR